MLEYVLIGISLVLLGVAGLQFSYLFYLERLDRERKKHVRYLERENRRLSDELAAAEDRLAEQAAMLEQVYPEYVLGDEETWADVIEDR
jgi:hypothetical protein